MRAPLLLMMLAASACATLRAPQPLDVRVLVYNIHAGKDASGVDNLQRVSELIRETQADIVLLQEVDSVTTRSGNVDQLAVLASRTGMHSAFGSTLAYQGGGYGIAILSRFPITSHRVIPLPNDPPQQRAGGSREPRGALVATVATPGGPLRVVNTHIDASGHDRWRRQEAARLVQVTDSLRALGPRLVVGGDLNSTPESVVQAMLRDGALRDAWAACGRGPSGTYPASEPVKRIDYLYLTGNATCTEARVIATETSDHRPVIVSVRMD